jgi:hypothetical protein
MDTVYLLPPTSYLLPLAPNQGAASWAQRAEVPIGERRSWFRAPKCPSFVGVLHLVSTMRVLSNLVFVLLQIVFLPLALVGLLLVAYKQMVVSKRLGVSQTGIEVLNGRWTMHVFGIRKDLAAAQLASVMPNTSIFGLWLVLLPLWVKYRMSGTYFGYPRVPEEGAEGIADIVVARTLYFDRIIERVSGDMEQFVVMGAGYDTRAYGTLKRRGLTFFELDQRATQKLKIQGLHRAGIDTSDVRFVEVDSGRPWSIRTRGLASDCPLRPTSRTA